MMKTRIFIGIIAVLAYLPSCTSTELGRNDASELIQNHFNFPIVEVVEFSTHWRNDSPCTIDKGLIIAAQGWAATGTISDYGAAYLIPNWNEEKSRSKVQVAANQLIFQEITGILFTNPEKTQATVEYTLLRNAITPFGECMEFVEGDELQKSSDLQKYDDGWRVIDEQGEDEEEMILYLPADFPAAF